MKVYSHFGVYYSNFQKNWEHPFQITLLLSLCLPARTMRFQTLPFVGTLHWWASKTKAGQNRWEVYYLKYQSSKKARKPKSESDSVSESIKQKAIANYQKQLNQEKNGYGKTGHEISASKFNQLLDNPDNQIKRINKIESQPQKISQPLGKYVSEGCEHLRNLRMKSLFSNESIQGGMA